MEKVECQSPIAGKMSSAALRKIKKPIIEKRRRERINDSLNQLKALVLDAMQKDESRYSKMEKADILEMTVHHIKHMHRQQAHAQPDIHSMNQKYTAGYSECANEVAQFVNNTEYLAPDVRHRIMNHMSASMQKANQRQPKIQAPKPILATPAYSTVTPAMVPITALPCATQVASLPGCSEAQYPASVSPLSLVTSQSLPLTLSNGMLVIQPGMTSPGSTASLSPSNISASSSPSHSMSSMSPVHLPSSGASSPVSGAIPLYATPSGARYSPVSPCEDRYSTSPSLVDDAPHSLMDHGKIIRNTVIAKNHSNHLVSSCKSHARADYNIMSHRSMWRPW